MRIFTKRLEKHDNQSFLHISRVNGLIKVGESYSFVEFGTNEFIRNAICVSTRTIQRHQISPEISYLAENCDPEILGLIIDARNWKDDNLQLSVFSDEKEIEKIPVRGCFFDQSEGIVNHYDLVQISTFTNKGNVRELVRQTIEKFENEHYSDKKIKIKKI